jgi:RNA-directed DNA polymerase
MSPPSQRPLQSADEVRKLNLYSMARLEALLGFPRVDIKRIAANAGSYYEPFYKKEKTRPFQKKTKVRKPRQIDNPKGELKTIQKNIHRNILKRIELPENILGGVTGRTIGENASRHVGGRVLATIDIKQFFPSVTSLHVYKIWRQFLNCSPEISELLTKLTTSERHLPQGGPTSTILANLVIVSCDSKIRAECKRLGVEYSGWVDDLAFSGDNPRAIINVAISQLATEGLSVSRGKVRVMGPRSPKLLTGTRLGVAPRADLAMCSRIRSGIHKYKTGKVAKHLCEEYLKSLDGKIAHLASLDPAKGKRLKKDLNVAICIRSRLNATLNG